ncbi:MAG TPA: CapA family protein [Nitrospirota bacterium]|nr:CapA family protein [Nitrospirota bacterium]
MKFKSLAAASFICCLLSVSFVFPASAAELTLMAVGDILPHASWQKFEVPVSALMKGVTEKLYEADVLIGNLESPLTDFSEPTPNKSGQAIKAKKDFVFRSALPDSAKGLKDCGFTVLTLANNHMLDYQEQGVVDTLDRLRGVGICTAGAGCEIYEAVKPAVVETKGRKIIVLAASDVVPKGYEAEPGKPGIVSMKDADSLMSRVMDTREEHPGAIIVLSLHWGVEATLTPSMRQKELARHLIDCGADVILGHHPHRIQGVELYRGRPIFYSLGNFQFDSNSPGDESVIAKVVFSDGRLEPAKVSVLPVFIGKGGAPRVLGARDPGRTAILKKVDELSRPLGAQLKGDAVVPLPVSSYF